jgi:hypothetical protein
MPKEQTKEKWIPLKQRMVTAERVMKINSKNTANIQTP